MGRNYGDADKVRFLEILDECDGYVTVACKKFGVSVNAYYLWLQKHEWFQKAAMNVIDTCKEKKGDFTEKMLFKNIAKGKEHSIFFYLKNLHAKRGYDKDAVASSSNAPTEIIIRTAEDESKSKSSTNSKKEDKTDKE